MEKYYLLLGLIVVSLSGCASIPPPARVSGVAVTKAPGKDVHILDVYITETDGRLAVCGRARQVFQWTRVGPTHVDVQFLDGNGQELALKSVTIRLQNRRSSRSYPSPVFFQIPSEPWTQALVLSCSPDRDQLIWPLKTGAEFRGIAQSYPKL